MQRTRLIDVQLKGALSWIRRAGFGALIALSATGFVGYLLPAHSRDGELAHSNFADGGMFSLVVFGAFALIAAILRTRRLGAGVVTGVLGGATAFAAMMPIVLAHMLGEIDHHYGDTVLGVGVIGLFFGGIAFAIAEPILYVLQRRADERRARPNLPVARAYA